MKTDKNGKLIKYWVCDSEINVINEDHVEFKNPAEEHALFNSFEEAALFAISGLADRVRLLEDLIEKE
jgi:hypothetical protein